MQHLTRGAGKLGTASMMMFSAGEQVNNRAALIAAFKLYREKGLNFDEAYNKAIDFNRRVNFGGGKANRPIGPFSSRSPVLRGTAMLGTAMQSYVLGTTFQLLRYLKGSGFRPNGLTPGETHAARKALGQMLGTQFAAAGLLGLPFVSGALALLEKGLGIEVNKGLRESVRSLMQEDDEDGSLLTDMSMAGLPSMLGWDFQSRFTMGNVPGVSEMNGFQPENLLSAPGNLITNFIMGAGKVATGKEGAMKHFTPSAFKKMADYWGGEGKLKDYRDREVLNPTPGETLGLHLGFNPKRLSDFNAASRMSELAETNSRREEGEFRMQMAETLSAGNFGSVQGMLRERVKQDPTYDLTQAIRGISQAAEELVYPRDLRREGTAARSKLLEMWNLPQSDASEVERLQFRQKIEAKFGLAPDNRFSLKRAALMDSLRLQFPDATRSELRRMADSALKRETSQVRLE